MTYSLKDGLKQGNNGFFGPKIIELGRRVWQERNVITFLGTSDTPKLNGLRIELIRNSTIGKSERELLGRSLPRNHHRDRRVFRVAGKTYGFGMNKKGYWNGDLVGWAVPTKITLTNTVNGCPYPGVRMANSADAKSRAAEECY